MGVFVVCVQGDFKLGFFFCENMQGRCEVLLLRSMFLSERSLIFFAPIWWFLPLGSLDVHDLMYAQIWLLLVVIKDFSYLVGVMPEF